MTAEAPTPGSASPSARPSTTPAVAKVLAQKAAKKQANAAGGKKQKIKKKQASLMSFFGGK